MQDFFETAEPRLVAMLLGAMLLLIGAIQVTYLLWPQIKQFNAVSKSHAVLLGVVNNSEGLDQQLGKAQSEVQTLARQLHGDMAGLPAKQMESYIIGRLQKVSWDTGVELISVKPGDGQKVQMFQESLFDVELHAALFRFFQLAADDWSGIGFHCDQKI